jgi:hypothetical protein
MQKESAIKQITKNDAVCAGEKGEFRRLWHRNGYLILFSLGSRVPHPKGSTGFMRASITTAPAETHRGYCE